MICILIGDITKGAKSMKMYRWVEEDSMEVGKDLDGLGPW